MSKQGMTLAAAIGAALFSGSSAMAFVPWASPTGTGSFFSWENGGSATGLYGSPILLAGDTFVFFPSEFRAQSSNGGSASATDRLEVDLIAHAGFRFSAIMIQEYGDYGIANEGSVTASGSLTIGDLNNASRSVGANLDTNPGFPVSGPVVPGASWTGSAAADLGSIVGASWTRIHLTLQNDLLAISLPGSSAYIQKSVLGGGVAMTIVPTPASLAVLGLGGLVAARRRRA
jgi:MYXO-CTERM domain-containing protein